ncbi:contractile injection system protein, VgrG/Pvc8 family [Bartonella sp. DGB2]|uniref:contractile injection system protein, VgrG/Pvc8 family n=2 Tax=Bartonella sp. DGB2 TaxID=3388426 RepID=UPI00398FC26A
MQPICQIISHERDITNKIAPYLLEVEVKDEAANKSNSLTLTLDDAKSAGHDGLTIPLIGTVIGVRLGYTEGEVRDLGSFTIDTIALKPNPRSLTITGHSADMHKTYRSAKSQSYHQTTLGTIAQEIATRNGFEAKLDRDLAKIVIRHIDQHNESDMAFAARLASMYDAVAKPVDGKLVLAKRGTAKSLSGTDLGVFTLKESMCSDWKFSYEARVEAGQANGLASTAWELPEEKDTKPSGKEDIIHSGDMDKKDDRPADKGGVTVQYNDIRSGSVKSVQVGNAPYQQARHRAHNEAAAVSLASTQKNEATRGKAKFSFEMGGAPSIMAETKIVLSPPFRPYMPSTWRALSVSHKLTAESGYVTSVECEIFDENQERIVDHIQATTPSKDDLIDDNAPPQNTANDDVIHIS